MFWSESLDVLNPAREVEKAMANKKLEHAVNYEHGKAGLQEICRICNKENTAKCKKCEAIKAVMNSGRKSGVKFKTEVKNKSKVKGFISRFNTLWY